MFLVAHLINADTYPVWSVVNMLTIITHFPLLYLQLPGAITLFMKEFLSVLRLQDLQPQRIWFYYGITSEFDKAYLVDRGYNIYFE